MANTPHNNTEPALLIPFIFSILADLQSGHLIPIDIGLPQNGHVSAEDDISLPQSPHSINALITLQLL